VQLLASGAGGERDVEQAGIAPIGAGPGLPEWLQAGVGAEAHAAMRAHPAFGRALSCVASGMTGLYAGNRLMNRLLGDRGRAVFGLLVLYLHALAPARGGGLTAARMAALCMHTGLCSRGRAKALLALMRWGGYVAPEADPGDRRSKPLVPQERLRALQRQRWDVMFGAVALVDPAMERLARRLGEPAFSDALIVALGDAFCAGYRVVSDAPPLDGLIDHDGALMVLLALLSCEDEDQPPPAIAELARRFDLSRAHVLQLLREGEARGLVQRGEKGAGRLSPAGRDAAGRFFAAAFCLVAASAREAEREAARA